LPSLHEIAAIRQADKMEMEDSFILGKAFSKYSKNVLPLLNILLFANLQCYESIQVFDILMHFGYVLVCRGLVRRFQDGRDSGGLYYYVRGYRRSFD